MKISRKPTYNNNRKNNLVLGTVGLGGAWGTIDREESIEAIRYGINNGIRRLDTAPAYLNAEEIIGEALRKLKGKRPFISTKVGKLKGKALDNGLNNYQPAIMLESMLNSMDSLGCRKLDLLFLHEPENVPEDQIEEVIQFLMGLKRTGRVTSIGFGGMPPKMFWPYIEKGIFDVVMGYNNLDASCWDGLKEDIPFCKNHNLTMYQGSLLHMGLLGNRYEKYVAKKPAWISKSAVKNAIKINQLAQKYKMPLSTFAHRFAMSIKEIDWMVLGSRNMEQLKNTLSDFKKGPLDKPLFMEVLNRVRY